MIDRNARPCGPPTILFKILRKFEVKSDSQSHPERVGFECDIHEVFDKFHVYTYNCSPRLLQMRGIDQTNRH